MTISSEVRKAGPFNGNDVTTSFPFTFKVFDKGDLRVMRTTPSGIEAEIILDSDYSVTLNPDQDATPGGTVTFPISGDPLAEDWKLTIVGDIDALQPTDLTNGGGFYPQVIENSFDRLTMLVQQLEEELGRTIRISVSDATTGGLELPAAGSRPDRVLGFDANGNFTTYPLATATLQAAYESFTATTGQTDLTLPFSYTPGVNAVYVFRNGSKLKSGVDYQEISETLIRLVSGAEEGDLLEVITGIPLSDSNAGLAEVQVRYADDFAAATTLALSLPDGATVISPGADGIQTRYTVASGALTSPVPDTAAGVQFTQDGAGAVTRTAQDKLREAVSVKDFGAVGDGVTDDTAAIQAAINYAIYFGGGSLSLVSPGMRVFIPRGEYLISDTLHLGYGHNGFTSVILEGECTYGANSTTNLSGIIATFNDRPALNVQGGRYVRIRNIAVSGVNYAWLRANYPSISDRSVVSSWYGPDISAANNTRYAPYAGIAIDAYSGSTPPSPYPNVSYPAFLGSVPQYGKNFSSNTILENVSVNGFVVGLMVQPGAVPDGSNGDFITLRDCDFQYNVVGYADGHADARNPNVINCRIAHCHTVFDSRTYGNQIGSLAIAADGSSFESVYRLFNINLAGGNLQGGYSCRLSSCYSEDIVTLGDTFAAGGISRPGGVSMEECKFVFTIRSTEFSPVYTYNAPTTLLYLRNTLMNGAFGFHNINAITTVENLAFDKLQDDVFTPASGKAFKVAKTFTCGFFGPRSFSAKITPHEFYAYFGGKITPTRPIDSEALDITLDASAAAGTGYNFPIPWFVNQLIYGASKLPVSGVNPLVLNRATYNLTSVSLSGANYTFTADTGFITDGVGANTEPAFSVGKGDLVVDSVSGHVFFITTVSFSGTGPGATMTATMRQINNVKRLSAGSFEAGGVLSSNTGTLTFHNARRVYPSPYRVNFTATSGSGSITHKICGDESNVNFMVLPVEVNDYLISSNRSQSALDSVFPKFSKVTAVNVNNGSVTVDQNARRSYYGEAPLYIKALP